MASEKPRILIVDPDEYVAQSLITILGRNGFGLIHVPGFNEAVSELQRQVVHLVISEVNLTGSDGFELLRVVKSRFPAVGVLLITGYGTIESAVDAIKLGAYDYLTKPLVEEDIQLAVERALQQQMLSLENQRLRSRLERQSGLSTIVGQDYKMLKIFDVIETVADSRITVLITGASGTGKSLIARAIHRQSARREAPFIEVSCGAIPETLLESELFGHVKGAFTGAVIDKPGRFKAADGGTIFLDEISTASPALQVKLLRILQERQFEAVGSNRTETVDVRVILATNVDLQKEVDAGRFRQDLFYRVNVVNIVLPGLSERLSDIPLLAQHFVNKYRDEVRKDVEGIDDEAMHVLQGYHWPGNIRELENVIERAMVFTKRRKIVVEDLPPNLQKPMPSAVAVSEFKPQSLEESLQEPEKKIIASALRTNQWNRQATADMLQINRTTLYKKMKRHGLDVETPEYGLRNSE